MNEIIQRITEPYKFMLLVGEKSQQELGNYGLMN